MQVITKFLHRVDKNSSYPIILLIVDKYDGDDLLIINFLTTALPTIIWIGSYLFGAFSALSFFRKDGESLSVYFASWFVLSDIYIYMAGTWEAVAYTVSGYLIGGIIVIVSEWITKRSKQKQIEQLTN